VRFIYLLVENVVRNPLRSGLTAVCTMMLVWVVTLVWSILGFLDQATAEKTSNFKAVVTERWRLPSQMPFTYAATLREGAATDADDVRPRDSMTWSFVGASLDPKNRTFENMVFAFAMQPNKLLTMMDELDSLPPGQHEEFSQVVKQLEENRQGIILGKDRLATLNKKVGEKIVLHSFNYRDITLEVEILGQFPEGRYDGSAAINIDYLNRSMDAYEKETGSKHPMADKSLNLVWLRVDNTDEFTRIADQILSSPYYSNPAVKVETAASGIATFLEAYQDLFWGMRYLLAPFALFTMALVISNAISISVRERQTEFAVMKVLGFKPVHILSLVLGEALLLGAIAGLAGAAVIHLGINYLLGGVSFPIAFFGVFYISDSAYWWGPIVGMAAAFLGSIVPAVTACRVKVSEIFARVT
jgi:putative ABC transport system permease protein